MSGVALGPVVVGRPEVSRRAVIAAVGVVGAAAAAATLPGWHGATASAPSLDDVLRASFCGALVGAAFSLELDDDSPIPLTLSSVDGVGAAPAREHVFSLRLSGPEAARQGGQVGHLSSSAFPSTPLLVVPSGRPHVGGQDWIVTIVRGAA